MPSVKRGSVLMHRCIGVEGGEGGGGGGGGGGGEGFVMI